jgi:hypothetical protein
VLEGHSDTPQTLALCAGSALDDPKDAFGDLVDAGQSLPRIALPPRPIRLAREWRRWLVRTRGRLYLVGSRNGLRGRSERNGRLRTDDDRALIAPSLGMWSLTSVLDLNALTHRSNVDSFEAAGVTNDRPYGRRASRPAPARRRYAACEVAAEYKRTVRVALAHDTGSVARVEGDRSRELASRHMQDRLAHGRPLPERAKYEARSDTHSVATAESRRKHVDRADRPDKRRQ